MELPKPNKLEGTREIQIQGKVFNWTQSW